MGGRVYRYCEYTAVGLLGGGAMEAWRSVLVVMTTTEG